MEKSTLIGIGILLAVSAIVFHIWLSFSIFGLGDWGYRFSEGSVEMGVPSSWSGNELTGGMNVTIWRWPFHLVEGIFGIGGLAWNVTEKFLVMWQVVLLLPIVGFLLVRKLGFSHISAVFGSIFLSYDSYFLAIYTHGHIPLAIAGMWGALALYFSLHLAEKLRAEWAVLAGMMLAIAGYYDFRMAYIFAGVCTLYLISAWWQAEGVSRKRLAWLSGLFFAVFVALNAFWILPFSAAGSMAGNAVVGRDLFGNDYFELNEAIYLSHPFWTGYGVTWMSNQPTPWWLSMLGVLAWVGFWVGRKNRMVVFFALLSVLGILFSKQVAEPWGSLYYFLYDHLPGFNAFREASKFYVLIALGYSVGVGALVDRILSSSPRSEI